MGRTKSFDDELLKLLPVLRAFALTKTRNQFDADDLVSQTVARALEKWELFEPGTNMQGWLGTIMFNIFCSNGRRQKWLEFDNYAGVDSVSMFEAPDTALMVKEIDRVLSTMPAGKQKVIRFIAEGEGTYEDAAKKFGISMGAVKSQLNKGRKQLMELAS